MDIDQDSLRFVCFFGVILLGENLLMVQFNRKDGIMWTNLGRNVILYALIMRKSMGLGLKKLIMRSKGPFITIHNFKQMGKNPRYAEDHKMCWGADFPRPATGSSS